MTLIRDRIDQLINTFVLIGRGANQVAFRANGAAFELRTPTDSAYADLRLKNLQFDGYPVTARVFGIQKRQCVMSGPVDSNGLPNIISAPGGLNAQINASAFSLIRCTFAAGLDASGAIDYIGQDYTSVQGYGGIAANTTHFFYLEMNASTGALTPGRITIAPTYSRVAPLSPAIGQHWFNTSQDSSTSQPGMIMYEWSGSSWMPRRRVFIGEVTMGASAATSFATYAYERRYQSPWLAVSGSQAISFLHNLGMSVSEAEATLALHGRLNSSDIPSFVPFYISEAGITYGVLARGGTRNSTAFITGTNVHFTAGSWRTTSDYALSIDSGW